MDRPDFDRIRAFLLGTEDAEILRLVRILDAVFRSPRYRPGEATPSLERDLIAGVRAIFPTPFARKFVGWVDAAAEYREALDRAADPSLDAERRDRAMLATSRRFRDAFLEMWTCWLQIVHFLPFILMASLRRLDDEALGRHAAKELAQALYHYRTFYEKYENERRREADQLHLLIFLLKLFRRLSREGVLTEDFLLAPLWQGRAGGFSELFPERFDANMRLLHQLRNAIIHGRVQDRPPRVTAPISELVTWGFLDIIATLAPICRAFSLSYATKLVVGPPEVAYAEVEALDFSAIDGPREARYRVTSRPQLDDYAFVDRRLYFIARARQMGLGTGEVVEPRDYLDLTPFLIIERLRAAELAANPTPENRQRMLFALEQYLEPLRQMLFSELGGTIQRTMSTTGGDWETQLLLETIDRFKTRTGQLTSRISLGEGRAVTMATARFRLWLASQAHLASLIDTGRYDENGEQRPDAPGIAAQPVYDPDLFVEPADSAALTAFFESDRRCVLLVGPSGAGKSTLLVHRFLTRLRTGGLAVFLAGRQLDSASFRDLLVARLVGQISGNWRSLEDLDQFLDENGESLAIFVDAINEHSGNGGPLPLLADMIAAVKSEPALRRCKIAVTCRTETWIRYTQRYGGGQPLDPQLFFAPNGDAVRVASFEDPVLRRALYAAYQRHHGLSPSSFDGLSPGVQALIAQPFMMALIAESYGGGQIPRDLDYFSLFERLTERKTAAAQILWPASDILGRELLPRAIGEFCELLAEMVYAQLMETPAEGPSQANRDALALDAVDKSWPLQRYVRGDGPFSVLEAALQVGLIERLQVSRRDAEGRVLPSSAIAFFHDQYAQYWLAAAYQQRVLGWLDPAALADPRKIDALARNVAAIIAHSVEAPILAGALDHWLQKNLVIFHNRAVEPVMPLLDRLAAHESPAVRYHLVAIVTNLVLRRFLTAGEVYGAIFRSGSPRLRLAMVNAFVDFWPALPADAARAFIDVCDPEIDKEPLERLGDIFALRLRLEPQEVGRYLNDAISALRLGSLMAPRRFWRQFRFSLQFTIFSMMTCFDQPAAVAAVRDFFRANYRPLLGLLAESDGSMRPAEIAKRGIRQFLFQRFDSFGLEQWEKYIAAMEASGNDRFFTADGGVVQHDVLRAFLPYLVDLHNGDWQRLSLAPSGGLRDLVLRMLDYRPASIIGYNATLALPSIFLREGWSTTEDFIEELVARRTPSAIYFGNLLLANLSYTEPATATKALELIRGKILPLLLREDLPCDWSTMFCIAAPDIEQHWPAFEAILHQLVAHIDRSPDRPEARTAFGDALYKVCYCHDIGFGRRLIELLLREREVFLGPRWRATSMKVFAASLARSPAVLRAACAGEGLDESLIREARAAQSEDIIRQSRLFPFQVDINRFLAWLYVAEPRLRHAIVKYFIGSLATGDSVEDFAAGVRQTLVATINVFFGDDPEQAPRGRLTVEEIARAVQAARTRRRGGRQPGEARV